MVRYREWYGSSKPNVGLKLYAEVVADGIVSRETKGEVSYGVLDPAAFAEDGGKSIADRVAERKVWFRPADNARVARLGAMGPAARTTGRRRGRQADDRVLLDVPGQHPHNPGDAARPGAAGGHG